MGTDKGTKKVKRPKNFIDEVQFMISVDGIRRKATMREITYEIKQPSGKLGTINWKSFTFQIGDDPDFVAYDDTIAANNFAIFSAIRKWLRENK